MNDGHYQENDFVRFTWRVRIVRFFIVVHTALR